MPASERPRFRAYRVFATAAFVAAVVIFATGPRRPESTPPPQSSDRTIAGAYHIHTTDSDGALDRAAIARVAAESQLAFAIFTDHGDGTRAPLKPQYLHGVLCIDGVEISTNDGHYVALGMERAPYPLGGDGDAVAEDVARLGGFGVAAHPFSPRAELAWKDWTVPADGLEWLNADSEWRDEGRAALVRSLMGYPFWGERTLGALLDRPVPALVTWDGLSSTRKVVALPAHDAHGGVGREAGDRTWKLRVPSYRSTFRTFSMRVIAEGFPTGDAARDAARLLSAIRAGAVFTVIDVLAAPGSLDFRASSGGTTVHMGGTLPPGRDVVRFTARAQVPASASIALLRNGQVAVERDGGALDYESAETGSYRVEVRIPRAPGTPPVPWLLGNPIFRFAPAAPQPLAQPSLAAVDMSDRPWRSEVSPGSFATVAPSGPAATYTYRLGGGEVGSPFAAMVRDVRSLDFSHLRFRAQASSPMRVSAQVRFAEDGNRRWRKSFYVDGQHKEVLLPLASLRPADGPGPQPPATRATSILFVVDLTNAVPGSDGSFTISDLSLLR